MPVNFKIVNITYSNNDTGFFNIAKTPVQCGPESLHGPGKAHIRINQRRNVLILSPYLLNK